MPVLNIEDVPWEMWWLFIGIFLFGLLLPFLAAQGVLRVWYSIGFAHSRDSRKSKLSFFKQLVLGWLVLLPVYTWSAYYFNEQLKHV